MSIGVRMTRIGQGYDIHRLVPGRILRLGGVEIPFDKGEEAHSDGDVLLHAIIDALLGACAAGDIGTHFPPEEDAYKDISSRELLRKTVRIMEERGFTCVNIDTTVILEKPKIQPFVQKIRETIARDMALACDCVSVKGKSAEQCDAVGRGEAVEAHAVCFIRNR